MPLSPAQTTRLAGAYGTLAVACGALGAHALTRRQPPLDPRLIKAWETGSYYLLLHAVALLGLGGGVAQGRQHRYTNDFLAIGAGLFSGSIYGLVIADMLGMGRFKRLLGPITPVGGMYDPSAPWTQLPWENELTADH